MNKVFADTGWEDYLYWQTEDRKTLKKINQLIKDICRNGNEGIGKPEPLTGNLAGFWSRRINDKDRLIYRIDENNVYILACRYHYGDKFTPNDLDNMVSCYKNVFASSKTSPGVPAPGDN